MKSDNFGAWQPFRHDLIDVLPSTHGVYQIRVRNRDVPRVLEADSNGILYVGQGRLRDRLGRFFRCSTEPGVDVHQGGWLYLEFGFSERGFPFEDLEFRVGLTGSSTEAVEFEGTILLEYCRQFGELPPLNGAWNWSEWKKHH